VNIGYGLASANLAVENAKEGWYSNGKTKQLPGTGVTKDELNFKYYKNVRSEKNVSF
jgi:hypothetical protein